MSGASTDHDDLADLGELDEIRVRSGLEDVALVDVLDRVIGRGAVISGDLVLGVAGVDLVHVGLRLVIRTID